MVQTVNQQEQKFTLTSSDKTPGPSPLLKVVIQTGVLLPDPLKLLPLTPSDSTLYQGFQGWEYMYETYRRGELTPYEDTSVVPKSHLSVFP